MDITYFDRIFHVQITPRKFEPGKIFCIYGSTSRDKIYNVITTLTDKKLPL